MNFLDFEQPIAELEAKVRELRYLNQKEGVDIDDDIERLTKKIDTLTRKTFASLTDWQVAQVARHPRRPYTKDYIDALCDEFVELRGDRHFADDQAIIGGLARFGQWSVMVIGHQKGRETKEKVQRNFGMPRPEGYRKALRLMQLAERFALPILTFIDTPGAYPGIDAEERNQSEAIAANLLAMSTLRVPIIATVVGEGGSGGALALGVADVVLMLSYSIYSVISPEGCASILWKDAKKAPEAAAAMAMTADKLLANKLIDEVVTEPLGGAHRDVKQTTHTVGEAIRKHLLQLTRTPVETLLAERAAKIAAYGVFADG